MSGVVALIGGVSALLMLGITALLARLGAPPRGRPERWARRRPPGPLLLCLGDSITHGRIGADWVEGLRRRGLTAANGGHNGDLVWSLAQRLDAALQLAPDAIFVLIGSNDVMAAERPSRAAGYRRGNRLDRDPDLDWSTAQLDALLARVAAVGRPWAIGTIPPLGDAPTAAAALVDRWNTSIRAVAARHGGDVIEIGEALATLPGPPGSAGGRPYEGELGAIAWAMGAAGLLRYGLGWSWDRVGRARGWARTIDGIHLDDRSGAVVQAQVGAWARRVLGARDPGGSG